MAGVTLAFGYDTERPYGASDDRARGRLAALRGAGVRWVSSFCRGVEQPMLRPLSLARQPRDYAAAGAPGLVELPSSGWQDAIFTREHAEREPGRPAGGRATAFAHYHDLLQQAVELAPFRAPGPAAKPMGRAVTAQRLAAQVGGGPAVRAVHGDRAMFEPPRCPYPACAMHQQAAG